ARIRAGRKWRRSCLTPSSASSVSSAPPELKEPILQRVGAKTHCRGDRLSCLSVLPSFPSSLSQPIRAVGHSAGDSAAPELLFRLRELPNQLLDDPNVFQETQLLVASDVPFMLSIEEHDAIDVGDGII